MVVGRDRLLEISDAVLERLAQANEDGSLHDLLSMLGLQGMIGVEDDFDMGEADNAYGDILVLGNCEAKRNVLQAVAEDMGYSRGRFEFVDYTELQHFNCSKLAYSGRYAAVMCGPVPHKAGEMGDTSSILEELRHEDCGYPPLAELRDSGGTGELRITKSTFRAGLSMLEAKRAIRQDI